MNERQIEAIKGRLRFAFVAVVTAAMLALTLHHAARGLSALPATVVPALTAGFGLEFVAAAWNGRRRRPAGAPTEPR